MTKELARTFQVIFFIVTYSFIQTQLIATSYPQLLFDGPKSVNILEESVLWLYCKINSTSFTMEVTWRKNGITLTQDAPHIILRASNSSSSTTLLLVIDNVVSSDAGLYQCTAQDGTDYASGDALSINVSSGGILNGIVNPRILYEESHSTTQYNRTNADANEEVNLYLQLTRNYSNELSNVSVTWLQNGERLTEMSLDSAERNSGNLILRFSFVFNNSKAGVYQCLVYTNSGTEVYSTYPLRLDTDTAPTVKRLSPPVVYLTPPEKLVLEFLSSGRFEFLIWHRDNQALASDSAAPADFTEFTNFYEVFVREPTTNTDIGNYEASISGTGRDIRDTVMVSERRRPITTVMSIGHFRSVKVREGESVNISCTSTGAPTPTITWTLSNRSTNFSQTDTSSSNQTVTFDYPGQVVSVLHIEHPRYPQHDGLYECTGRNHVGSAFESTVNISLEVLVAPQVEVATISGETILAAGQDLNLACTITRGNPLPNSYTWIYLGSNDEMTSMMSLSSTYTVLSAQPDESGMYKCTVTNEAGSGSDFVLVTIYGAPDISFIVSSAKDFTVPVGSAIELYCVVEDDNITVNFTWQNPMGLAMSLASVNETTASTVIVAMESEDFGVYTCLADNGFGTDNRTVTISQGISPPIIDSPKVNVFEIISPARLTLSCSSLGYPLPEITWVQTFQDGFQIELYADNSTMEQIIDTINDVEVVSEYTIAATDLQDSANYTCIVTNLYGNMSNTYIVQVYLPPPNLTGSVLSTTAISLMWPLIEIDTNTIWCEIQIDDSPFSGSNSSHFNFNLSDIEVDRNSWTLMLNQLRPNTTYNISIRYLYRSTGNYASLMSIPILVTTYSSVHFRIFFDLPCSTRKNSFLLSNSKIKNALIVKLRQLCECVWESDSIISNGTLYCSQDSQPIAIYEGHFQGTVSELLDFKLYLARLIDSESILTINNYTLVISKCPGIFFDQSDYQCNVSTNTTITTITTIITPTISFPLKYWNPLSPFLICGGICVALAMVVVGMIIYSKGYCSNKKSSKQNTTTEEGMEIQKISKESQHSSINQRPESHIYDIASTSQRESVFILSPCDAYVKQQEKVVELDEDLYVEVPH